MRVVAVLHWIFFFLQKKIVAAFISVKLNLPNMKETIRLYSQIFLNSGQGLILKIAFGRTSK